jgi:hypothetical protein
MREHVAHMDKYQMREDQNTERDNGKSIGHVGMRTDILEEIDTQYTLIGDGYTDDTWWHGVPPDGK